MHVETSFIYRPAAKINCRKKQNPPGPWLIRTGLQYYITSSDSEHLNIVTQFHGNNFQVFCLFNNIYHVIIKH